MKPSRSAPSAAMALALILSACSGEAATAESEDTAPEEAAETAMDHDAAAYAEDETGGMIDAAIVDGLNERLAAYHADSGRDFHVILGMSTNGRDVEEVAEELRAERDADALIYVAGADRALAIVGADLSAELTDEAESAMVAHFEADALEEGLDTGVNAIIAAYDN